MPTPRLRLGQLLVDAGMISQKDLDEVLALQKNDGRRLGTLLVERGLINETQLTQILSHQLSVPWVSLLHIEFSRQLLNLVPHHVAERFCMVPIYVRHVRGQGRTLYVAVDDPGNEEGLRACADHSGLPVKAMIAPPSDIRNAIRVYYGVTVPTSSTPAPMEGEAAVPERDTTPEAAPADPPAAAPPVVVAEGPTVEIAELNVSSAELAAAEQRAAADEVIELIKPVETQPGLGQANAKPPEEIAPRKESPSAPDLPPETLPDPGAQSPEFADAAAARAKAQVSVVDARPLPQAKRPPMHERLRPFLDVVDESPTLLSNTGEPPSSQPVDTIPEPRGHAPRMIALTLLDGTTISLPAPRKQRQRPDTIAQPAPADDEVPSTMAADDDRAGLTARDLVAALRAVVHGADPKEILGPNLRWEAVTAALLSVLLRKGLVADWEFVDELRKI